MKNKKHERKILELIVADIRLPENVRRNAKLKLELITYADVKNVEKF